MLMDVSEGRIHGYKVNGTLALLISLFPAFSADEVVVHFSVRYRNCAGDDLQQYGLSTSILSANQDIIPCFNFKIKVVEKFLPRFMDGDLSKVNHEGE